MGEDDRGQKEIARAQKEVARDLMEWAEQYLAQATHSEWDRFIDGLSGPRYQNSEPQKIPMTPFCEPPEVWGDGKPMFETVSPLNYGTAYEIQELAMQGERALEKTMLFLRRYSGTGLMDWGPLERRYFFDIPSQLQMRAIARQRRGYGKRRYRVAQGRT